MFFNQITQQLGEVTSLRMPCEYISDPIQGFEKICKDKRYSLLLESAEIDSKDNVKSIMLVNAAVTFECFGLKVICTAQTQNGTGVLQHLSSQLDSLCISNQLANDTLEVNFKSPSSNITEEQRILEKNAFEVLRRIINDFKQNDDEPYAIFLAGAFAYDMYANFETLDDVKDGFNDCPDYCFYLAETLMVIDHQNEKSELIGNIFSGEHVYTNCFEVGRQLEDIKEIIAATACNKLDVLNNIEITREDLLGQTVVDVPDEQFIQNVNALKQQIKAGEIFQVVPSRGFSLECKDAIRAYRYLKLDNPSPYMFYVKHANFELFGASPESSLKFDSTTRQVEVYPIAGTRIRGLTNKGEIDHDLDSRIELELRSDRKEVSEHTMLVDLARNDIARISETGTRFVKDLLNVDRYSHVMHLVSRVVGTLKSDLDALHAYQACMNMGTLVGAPKLSAANLIRKTEQRKRGSYGGAVGYLNGLGDMDSCIVIRSAFVKNGTAFIQAGAGVVHDSVPELEAQETTNKAMAVIRAVAKSGIHSNG